MKITVHFFSTYFGFGYGLTPDAAVEACRAANYKTATEMKKLIKAHTAEGPTYNMMRLPNGALEVNANSWGGVQWTMPDGMAPGEVTKLANIAGRWVDPDNKEELRSVDREMTAE